MSVKPKHYIEYGALRTVIFLINLLPVKVIMWFSGLLGRIAWVVFPFRLDVVHANLSNVFPEMEEKEKFKLIRKTYIEFARTFGMIFIMHRKPFLELIENAEISGLDKVNEVLADGKGAILTTYHGCWFEAYFAWFNMAGLPTSLIYQKQANPLSDAFFIKQRMRYGESLEHFHSQEGMSVFQNSLEKNRLLIISLDQSYSDNGTHVPFFNRLLSCARGTAVLHLRTGAPVLTSVYYMKNDKLHIDFEKVDLPAYDEICEENINDITTRSIYWYEPYIQKYPEQWFSLFHRLWKKKGYTKVKRTLADIFSV